MILRPEADVSHADWFLSAEADWWTLATQGPPGHDAYAIVRFNDGDSPAYRSDDQVMALVVGIAAAHTRTRDDVFFGLWDGWGELTHADRVYATVRGNWLRDLWFRPLPPRPKPAFDDAVLDGPKVDLAEERAYLLFRGRASQVGAWGAAPFETDIERTLAPASLTWPADRAWFIAADAESSWLCIGGSERLVEAVLAHPDLDAEPTSHGVTHAGESEDR